LKHWVGRQQFLSRALGLLAGSRHLRSRVLQFLFEMLHLGMLVGVLGSRLRQIALQDDHPLLR
jgi:hypothetical protein